MMDQFDYIPVRVLQVCVVGAVILPATLTWIVSSPLLPERSSPPRPHGLAVCHPELVQIGKHLVPVIDLHRKMDQRGLNHVGGIAKVNFPGAKVRLELSTRRAVPDNSYVLKSLTFPSILSKLDQGITRTLRA
jgi:hypothetical protein